MPENSNKLEAKPQHKRRWGRALLISCLILVGLALWINGPGSRWFLRKAITEQLAHRGLEGSTIVSGQLWSGYQLEKTSVTGSGSLRALKVGPSIDPLPILRPAAQKNRSRGSEGHTRHPLSRTLTKRKRRLETCIRNPAQASSPHCPQQDRTPGHRGPGSPQGR